MITFVGKIDGDFIKADVFINGDSVSVDGPVWLSLDQWNALRDLPEESDGVALTESEAAENGMRL